MIKAYLSLPKIVKVGGLLFLLALAFYLRVVGFSWGAGYLTHSDEQFITEPAYWLSLKEGYDPGNYMRPAHWSIYVNHFVYEGVANAYFHKPLNEIYPGYRNFFTYISRIIVACWGTLLILVLFFLGQNIRKGSGWICASIGAIFPSYITHSHYVTVDISLSLFFCLAMFLMLGFFKTSKWIYFLLLLPVLAICIGEKYPGILVSVACGLHLLFFTPKEVEGIWRNRWIRIGILIVGVMFFVFLFTPYLFLQFIKVIKALQGESRTTHVGADGLGFWGNLIFYLGGIHQMTGTLFLIFILVGLIQLFSVDKNSLLVLLYPLFFLLIISKVSLHWERWALPFYVFPIVVGSLGIQFLIQKASKNWLSFGLFFFILISGLYMTVQDASILTNFVSKNSTLRLADEYCKEHKITNENSVFGSWTPFAPRGRFEFDFIGSVKDTSYMKNKKYILASSGVYQVLIKNRPSTNPEVIFYKKLLSQKSKRIFTPVIPAPTQIAIGPFGEFQCILNELMFLKAVWIDKMPYIPGDEIIIWESKNITFLDL